MFKSQMKFQKILSIALIIVGAITFVYAISFMTDLFPLYLSQAYGTVEGAEFFDEAQGYNNVLLVLSIVTIIAGVLPFFFNSNKRRKYYVDNYIGFGLQSVAYIGVAIFIIIGTITYKNSFLSQVDVEQYAAEALKRGWIYSGTTVFFDLGFVVAALLLVSVALIVFNVVWKIKIMKEEDKLLKGGN